MNFKQRQKHAKGILPNRLALGMGAVIAAIAASTVQAEPTATNIATAVTIQAGADWIPLPYDPWIEPGSALDFSSVLPHHAPAGKFGHVVTVGDHFEFERLPDVPQRFYGVNLCNTANLPSSPEAADRFVVNLYNDVDVQCATPSGAPLAISIGTDYPLDGHVRITVSPAAAEEFTLRLRIPSWSAGTAVAVNGAIWNQMSNHEIHETHEKATPCCHQPAVPGAYLELRREWHPGDVVELDFDMRCRRIEGPRGVNRAGDGRAAVMRGPVVLTREERFDPRFNEPTDIIADGGGFIEARRIAPPAEGVRLAVEVPTRDGPILMTDYASAGNWGKSRIRTWVPAP